MVEEISEKDSETRNGSIRLQLHDCLALGEFEKGLDLSSAFSSDNDLDVTKTSNEQVGSTDEEIHRLPLLLRLLHASRPLSSIPTFTDCGSELLRKHDDYDANGEDQLIGEVVARLEERAAAYSAAEGVQVVACHLAPTVTKSVSRFPPLQAIMIQSNKINMTTHIRGSLDVIYDTALLEETVLDMSTSACLVGGNISANGRKKGEKRKLVSSLDTGDAEDGALVSTDSENEMEVEVRDSKNKGRKRVRSESKHDSLENNMVSEDSQEFAIVKTMQELLQLTLQGLKQSPSNSFNFAGKTIDDEGETGGIVANNDNSALSITMHDSVLAAGARSHHQREMGGISDLGSTIVSLMHHIPCLRHRHLASALCRAAFSQTPELIKRMGANCAAAVPALIAGCVDVYRYAMSHKSTQEQRRNNHHIIAMLCKNSIRNIASLSEREASRVQAKLRQEGVLMMDLQLDLNIKHNPLAAVCLLINHLSTDIVPTETTLLVQVKEKTYSTAAIRRKSLTGSSKTMPKNVVRSLRDHLIASPDLTTGILNMFIIELDTRRLELEERKAKKIFSKISSGRLGLFLKGYTWLLYKISLDQMFTNSNPSQVCELISLIINSICNLLACLRDNISRYSENSLSMDDNWPYYNLVAALFSTFLSLFPSTKVEKKGVLEKEIESLRMNALKLLMNCLTFPEFSASSNIVPTLIISALKQANFKSVQLILQKVLQCDHFEADLRLSLTDFDFSRRLFNASIWTISTELWTTKHCFTDALDHFDLSILTHFVLDEDVPIEEKSTKVIHYVNLILEVDSTNFKKETFQLLRCPHFAPFLEAACRLLYQNDGSTKVPLIFPIQIEQLSSKVYFGERSKLDHDYAIFIIRFYYCFLFLEMCPISPFTFDPRLMPLKQVYADCEKPGLLRELNANFSCKLKRLIDRHCPEIRLRSRWYVIMNNSEQRRNKYAPGNTGMNKQKQDFINILRKSISQPSSDQNGLLAEKAFAIASHWMNDNELTMMAASAILSTPLSTPRFYTYPMLYRDPLTILKCPISVWNRTGLRRIALLILASLLEVNENLVRQSSINTDSQNEFIDSRNEIVLRALVNSIAESVSKCPSVCGFIRKIISGSRGITAMLFKHKLMENHTDLLVEASPEMMSDASSLISLLSDRTSLISSESLVAAEILVHLAVVHGHQNESYAVNLLQTGLIQLINSFFLIIGQDGIAMSNIGTEDSGSLNTMLSSKSAFRMLKALQMVRRYRSKIQNECGLSLQKVAGLCRGEILIGNLPSAINSRQKGVLKELLEATSRAADSMGLVVHSG